MDNTREKLIELITDKENDLIRKIVWFTDTFRIKEVANHLIANGVTVTDTNVGKWIPVTERLPEENERVMVYHDDGVVRFGINKGGFADVVSSVYLKSHHKTVFSRATHWMPLPEPPKGE